MTEKERLLRDVEAFDALWFDRAERIKEWKSAKPPGWEEFVDNAEKQMALALEKKRDAEEALRRIQ